MDLISFGHVDNGIVYTQLVNRIYTNIVDPLISNDSRLNLKDESILNN